MRWAEPASARKSSPSLARFRTTEPKWLYDPSARGVAYVMGSIAAASAPAARSSSDTALRFPRRIEPLERRISDLATHRIQCGAALDRAQDTTADGASTSQPATSSWLTSAAGFTDSLSQSVSAHRSLPDTSS